MSTMAMAPCDGGDAADWFRVLGDFNLLLCSSSSSTHAMASTRAAADWLPAIAAAAPPGGGHLHSCKSEALDASSDAAFAAADCFSLPSALMNLQGVDESLYMPMMYTAPPPEVAVAGDQSYCSDQLPPLPAVVDGALTSLDDALLLPFSDIDLAAFENNADEHKPPPLDQKLMIPPAPAVHHCHPPAAAAAAGTRTAAIHGTTVVGQNAGVVVHAHRKEEAMAGIEDSCFRGGAGGVEMAVVGHYHDEKREASSAAVALVPPPSMPLPPPPRPRAIRRSGGGGGDRRPGPPAAAGKTTRLDHIGFEELRKYFYMPITRAAREMNVGLTVLKKRCRELGVARWPHRKMKSLKSLMANVQEMGNGMSPVALQQELAALETYCALMEEQPWMELTDRTKKLRQACFKESYKRRRAAAVGSVMEEMDHHIYGSFGHGQQHEHGHNHQQLPPPTGIIIADDDRHGHQQSNRFFGCYTEESDR